MTKFEFKLFKKTADDGTIERYSVWVKGTFDQFGFDIAIPAGPLVGQLSEANSILKFPLELKYELAEGELPVVVENTQTHVRQISNFPWEVGLEFIEVEINTVDSGTIKGSILIADADEEEARPIPIINA